MIAEACVASHLSPAAFGLDDVDVPVVAEQILVVLKEQAADMEAEQRMASLKGRFS